MGMCQCTMIGCPIGLVAGGVTAPVLANVRTVRRPQGRSRKELLLWLYGGLLLAPGFFFLYLPLTILCARADHRPWRLYPGDSLNCMSEGGDFLFGNLGLLAGLAMGAGFAGLLCIFLCGCGRQQNNNEEPYQEIVVVGQADEHAPRCIAEMVRSEDEDDIL